MRISKLLPPFLLFMAALIVGFFVGKIYNLPGITINRELDPLHAIAVLTPLFVAIWISVVFDSEKEKHGKEKNVILDRVSSALNIADNLHDRILCETMEITTATSTMKRLGITSKCIYTQLNLASMRTKLHEKTIEDKLREIKGLLTNTPVVAEGSEGDGPPVKVENNTLIFSRYRVAELETQMDQLKNMLFELQMQVIRS